MKSSYRAYIFRAIKQHFEHSLALVPQLQHQGSAMRELGNGQFPSYPMLL